MKTGSRFEEIASYSRVVTVDNWIFVSNTAGRNPETNEMPDDVFEQTEQVFLNIERALAAVDASLADVVTSKVFIQNPEDVSAVMEYIGSKFKGIDPATTVTCPPLGSSIYKVELEVTAYRGASNSETEKRIIG
ncbi:RidA family protein [Vibrio sp. YIC-376]|uniref:RidA family protein n=1 Tax=Vibrio sp. YIC-376 TaxID=3136162 RepID=UPI00402A6C84